MRLLFPLLCFISLCLHAQTDKSPRTHEIGVRLNGLDDFNLMYKTSIGEDTYRRYRLLLTEIDLVTTDGNNAGTFSFGGSIGKERRSDVAEKLQFNRGPELFASVLAVGTDDDFRLQLRPGFGYVLGLQYNLSDQFYVGLETIPSVTLRIDPGDPVTVGVNAGFNSTAVSLLALYRFTR